MKPFKGNTLTKQLETVQALLLENDTVTKLLFYESDDALSKPSLTVLEKKSLINTKLTKRRTLKALENTSGSFINFRLNHFRESDENPNTIIHTLDFYIVCHNGTITTDNGERDLLLVEAITQIFYNQNTIGQGRPKLNVIEDLIFDSNDFSGYLVSLLIQDQTLT